MPEAVRAHFEKERQALASKVIRRIDEARLLPTSAPADG